MNFNYSRQNEVKDKIKMKLLTENRIISGGVLDDITTLIENETTIKHKPYDWPRQDLLLMETLLMDFKSHLIRRGVFPMTQRKYLKDMRQFFKEKGITDVKSINRET